MKPSLLPPRSWARRNAPGRRTREEACVLLSAVAGGARSISFADSHLEVGAESYWLAFDAIMAAPSAPDGTTEGRYAWVCAEAEAMLQTGWAP